MFGNLLLMINDSIIDLILNRLNISAKELEDFSSYYNKDYNAYGNEVYEDIKVRLVHLDNFLKDNFWNNRFYFLWRDFCNYGEIVDIGFSVPYLPIHLLNINDMHKLPRLIYVDGNKTSEKMARIILESLNIEAQFVVGDAQDNGTWNDIKKIVSDRKRLFTAFETIEHFDRPELFWKEIGYFRDDHLMLSLPIGPKIPSHHSVFQSESQIVEYLEKYLDIKESKLFSSDESSYVIYTALGIIK